MEPPTDIAFMLWVKIHHYIIHFVAQIVPALAVASSLAPGDLWHVSAMLFFGNFAIFWHCIMVRAHNVLFPVPN